MSYVLIIESDPVHARRLANLCLRMRLEVEVSPDPLHGLMRALRDEPDVILIEASDAWFGTLPFVEALHRDPRLSPIPIVVVLADSAAWSEPSYRSFRDVDACTPATMEDLEGVLDRLGNRDGSLHRHGAPVSSFAVSEKWMD